MRLILLLILFLITISVIYLTLFPRLANSHSADEDFGEKVAVSSGDWVENWNNPVFDNQVLTVYPQKYEDGKLVKNTLNNPQVLGTNNSDEKWLEVNLTEQKIYAWEGSRKVFEFFVSTGRPGYETPTGQFRVWRKVKYQAYTGGSKARGDYYYLPNVPYSLFFYNDKVAKGKGYAVHGAYWHNDFGIKRKSSGCVNVRPEEAAQIYYWAGPVMPEGINAINASSDNPGIRIVIHY